LFFANAERFAKRLTDAIDGRPEPTRWVIVAAEPLTDIDTTAAETLGQLLDDLDARGVERAFAELKGPVKDRLRDYDLYERVGDDRFFPTLGTAIGAYLDETGTAWTDWTER
jgi:MFS superfamily sulfate permease-like transporter